jgi:hypothetical protein
MNMKFSKKVFATVQYVLPQRQLTCFVSESRVQQGCAPLNLFAICYLLYTTA